MSKNICLSSRHKANKNPRQKKHVKMVHCNCAMTARRLCSHASIFGLFLVQTKWGGGKQSEI